MYSAHLQRADALGLTPELVERFQSMLHAGLAAIETCTQAGVELGFGTDLEGDLDVFQPSEFRLRAEVLPSVEILRQATLMPARVMGLEGLIGTLSPGAHADLLVLDGNPLEDVTILGTNGPGGIRTVIQGGVIRSET